MKFKDNDSLLAGYENLEKEFTKKCQELARLKKLVEVGSNDSARLKKLVEVGSNDSARLGLNDSAKLDANTARKDGDNMIAVSHSDYEENEAVADLKNCRNNNETDNNRTAFDKTGSGFEENSIAFDKSGSGLEENSTAFDKTGSGLEENSTVFDKTGRVLEENSINADKCKNIIDKKLTIFDGLCKNDVDGSVLDNIHTNSDKNGRALDKIDGDLDKTSSVLDGSTTDKRNESDNFWKSAEWRKEVAKFFSRQPQAKQYAKDISKILLQSPSIAGLSERLDIAFALALKNNTFDNSSLDKQSAGDVSPQVRGRANSFAESFDALGESSRSADTHSLNSTYAFDKFGETVGDRPNILRKENDYLTNADKSTVLNNYFAEIKNKAMSAPKVLAGNSSTTIVSPKRRFGSLQEANNYLLRLLNNI